jgi:hypothetical protein
MRRRSNLPAVYSVGVKRVLFTALHPTKTILQQTKKIIILPQILEDTKNHEGL